MSLEWGSKPQKFNFIIKIFTMRVILPDSETTFFYVNIEFLFFSSFSPFVCYTIVFIDNELKREASNLHPYFTVLIMSMFYLINVLLCHCNNFIPNYLSKKVSVPN